MSSEYNLTETESVDLDKLNKGNFDNYEFQGFSIKTILAHLVDCSSEDEVKVCLESVLGD